MNYGKMHLRSFSVLELLIVIVIIGILGTLSIPIYKEVLITTKLTEMVRAGDAYTKSVDLYFIEVGWPTNPSEAANAVGKGIAETGIMTKYVEVGQWSYDTGRFQYTIVFRPKGPPYGNIAAIRGYKDGRKKWAVSYLYPHPWEKSFRRLVPDVTSVAYFPDNW